MVHKLALNRLLVVLVQFEVSSDVVKRNHQRLKSSLVLHSTLFVHIVFFLYNCQCRHLWYIHLKFLLRHAINLQSMELLELRFYLFFQKDIVIVEFLHIEFLDSLYFPLLQVSSNELV